MKTENLNFVEAVDAMRRGECVEDSDGDIHKIIDSNLFCFLPRTKQWDKSRAITFPCRIVPDPSKPKESERLWKVVEDFIARICRQIPLAPGVGLDIRNSLEAALRAVADAVKAELKEEAGK